MEMTAAVMALRSVRETDTPVVMMTDSAFLIGGITQWLPKWKNNGWKSSQGKVANWELWEELDRLGEGKTTHWLKVAGHSGHDLRWPTPWHPMPLMDGIRTEGHRFGRGIPTGLSDRPLGRG